MLDIDTLGIGWFGGKEIGVVGIVDSCSRISSVEVCGGSKIGASSLVRFLWVSKFASTLCDVLLRTRSLAEDGIDFLEELG